MASNIDHIQSALDRLITQYTEADTVQDYLRAVLEEANTLEEVFCDLIEDRFIDTAVGANLDVIGELVGQPRTLLNAAQLFFFGFESAPGAQSFGSLANPTEGGRWRGVNESTTGNIILTDEEYRLFIRARIKKNYTRATIEDIIDMIIFILGATRVVISEGDRAYLAEIGKLLTPNEQALISGTDLLPKPIGVRANYIAFFDPDDFLAFGSSESGGLIPGTQGLGTLSDPSAGGKFAQLIL